MKIRTQLIAGIVVFALLIIVIFALVLNTNQQVDRLIAQENTANSIALDVGEARLPLERLYPVPNT